MDPSRDRTLAAPAFPDDTGAADPALREALARWAARPGDPAAYVGVLAALRGARVLVPVVAVAGEVELDERGLAHDKTSDMASVLLTGSDGRTALLAFTGLDTMSAWDPAARPVAVTAATAAVAARQDGADAVLLDLAGPARLVLEGETLLGVAHGWEPALVGDQPAWLRTDGDPDGDPDSDTDGDPVRAAGIGPAPE